MEDKLAVIEKDVEHKRVAKSPFEVKFTSLVICRAFRIVCFANMCNLTIAYRSSEVFRNSDFGTNQRVYERTSLCEVQRVAKSSDKRTHRDMYQRGVLFWRCW